MDLYQVLTKDANQVNLELLANNIKISNNPMLNTVRLCQLHLTANPIVSNPYFERIMLKSDSTHDKILELESLSYLNILNQCLPVIGLIDLIAEYHQNPYVFLFNREDLAVYDINTKKCIVEHQLKIKDKNEIHRLNNNSICFCEDCNKIIFIDLSTLVISTIAILNRPYGRLFYSNITNYLYLSDNRNPSSLKIMTISNQIIYRINFKNKIQYVNADDNYLYATFIGGSHIFIIDHDTYTLSDKLQTYNQIYKIYLYGNLLILDTIDSLLLYDKTSLSLLLTIKISSYYIDAHLLYHDNQIFDLLLMESVGSFKGDLFKNDVSYSLNNNSIVISYKEFTRSIRLDKYYKIMILNI